MYDLGCTASSSGRRYGGRSENIAWPDSNEVHKVLTGEALQASCYRCHELKPRKGAEKALQGAKFFYEAASDTCHTTEGRKGASYGPDLSDVGSFLGLKDIHTAIESPKAEPANSIMPKFSLAPDDIRAISYFLKSRVKDPTMKHR
jgi:hypothetical protein